MELKLTQSLQLVRPEIDFEISSSIAPEEMARRIRIAFKQMPEDSALVVFAKVMTSNVPHDMKVAVWDAVRYSHIWWTVDEVLKGEVMMDAVVQCAFADAVAMRCWRVANKVGDWHCDWMMTRQSWEDGVFVEFRDLRDVAIGTVVRNSDKSAARLVTQLEEDCPGVVSGFADEVGRNLLWYQTFRDDQQAQGGFACPLLTKALLDIGVDPNKKNKLGLCWNDVSRHINRPGA